MTAGSIVIDLVMRTGMFETDTKRAEKRLQEFGKRARQVGAAIGAMTATAAGALALMVNNNLKAIDSLQKMASQIGTTTEDLSSLQYAAQQMANVGDQQFGQALRRMTRRITEAGQGAGPAAAALERMGLNAKELARLRPDEQFRKLADALKEGGNQGEKLQNIMALFDTEGMPLVNMLSEGADGIREFEEEARQLGITISQDLADQAAQFRTELGKLDGVKRGIVNRITAEMLPSLTKMVGKFNDAEGATERLDKIARVASTGIKLLASVGVIVTGVFKTVGEALGGIAAMVVQLLQGNFREAWSISEQGGADIVANVKGMWTDLKDVWSDELPAPEGKPVAGAVEEDFEEAEENVTKGASRLVDAADRAWQQVENAVGRIQRDLATFGMSQEEVQLFDLSVMGADPDQLARAAAMLEALVDLRAKEEELRAQTERDRRALDIVTDIEREIEALGMSNEQLAIRNALLRAGVDLESDWGEQIAEAVGELYRQGEAMDKQIQAMDGLRETTRGFFHDLKEGVGLWDSLKNAAQRFADVLFDLAVQGIVEQLFGQRGQGGGGSFGDAIGGFLGSMFGGSRATGGDALPGRGYWIGEQGPEWFQPRTAGTVIPHEEARRATGAGGGSVTQNNNFHYAAPPDPRMQINTAARTGFELARASKRLGA